MSKTVTDKYPSLDKQTITEILVKHKALMVHQLTLVDYLNALNNPEELSKNFIKDDPNKDGTGYGVGITVAKRIINERRKLKGFKSLTDLMNIPYFGVDKFNDLIYTYVNYYLPIPTSLGSAFDRLLMALSRLELFASGKGIIGNEFVGLLHSIYQEETGDDIDFDWAEELKAESPSINMEWYRNSTFQEDVNVLKSSRRLTIGKNETNFQHLITTLFGLISTRNINTIAFESRLGKATSKYINEKSSEEDVVIQNTEVDSFHFEAMSQSHYHGMADALAMDYDSSSSFIWNLLNYYTKEDKSSSNKFEIAANAFGLGNWRSSWNRFYYDKPALRSQWAIEVEKSANDYNNRILGVSSRRSGTNPQTVEVSLKNIDSFIDMLSALSQSEEEGSNLVTWNRLESRPRTDDYTRTMLAEVRDPLWILARQYQFGEFLGEDSGSAIETRVNIRKSKLNAFAGINPDSAVSYNEQEPLEMTVEKTDVNIDLMSRLEMCRWWKRKLKSVTLGADFLEDLYVHPEVVIDEKSWNIVVAAEGLKAEVESNSEYWSIHQLLSSWNYFDGFKLYEYLKEGNTSNDISPDHGSIANSLVLSFLSWVEKKYLGIYATQSESWNENRLEYSFACSAPSINESTEVFTAQEYSNGHLDWYYFNKSNSNNYSGLVPSTVDNDLVEHSLKTMIPVQMEFPGMPLARWWQLEDYKINFDKLTINRNDTATLAFTEFVTLYSNDWLIVPLNLNAGSICNIESIVVKDVFGQYTKVQTANRESDDWQRWSMFDISDISGEINNTIIIPPSLVKSQESKPFEEVSLIRDEMANMIWGIETKISDQLLGYKDGFEASLDRVRIMNIEEETDIPEDLDKNVKIAYRLGNKVPENWIPFIPSLVNESANEIQFLRGSMPKPKPNGDGYDRIRPMTSLMRVNLDNSSNKRYFIHEEEVPKAGAIVSRNWQRTRWYNGKVCWWAANKKTIGKGQGSSGLKWDIIEDLD